MHFCLLCGYGASAVNPYMAFEAIHKMHADGDLPAEVGRRSIGRPVHHRRQEGHPQDDSEDGHLDAAELSCGPAVRGRRTEPRRGAAIFHRHGLAHRGRRPGRAGRRGPGAASRRLRPPRRRAPWTSTTAASTTSASTAKTTSGTPPPSPGSSTPSSRTTRRSTRSMPAAVNEQGRDLCTLRGLFEFVPGRAGAAGRGRAGRRDRQAVLHRRHVARLDQQGGPRGAGGGDEPAGRHVEHRAKGAKTRPVTGRCPTATRPTAASSRWPAPASA